jgi:DNA (cytosine-5)-methyltransferase 1
MTTPLMRGPFRVGSLFSGIGGFEIGLARAGHKIAMFCEIDPVAREVLRARFPGVRIRQDIRAVRSIPQTVQIITAGFPCQDLSPAGRVGGALGTNSSLVFEAFRIVEMAKPEFVLLENVPFMLRLDRGAAIDMIVSELEYLNYKWAYRIIDSAAFGIPQRRPRVFILGSKRVDPRTVLFAANTKPQIDREVRSRLGHGFYWTEGNRGIGWGRGCIPALKGGSSIGIPSPPAVILPNGKIVTPHICDAERLQGFPRHWTAPAARVAKPSARWRLIGNAVNVRIARWIGDRLRKVTEYDVIGETPLCDGEPWPSAAYNIGKGRFKVPSDPFPVNYKSRSISAFLKFDSQPLSQRATAGFLSRIEESSLHPPKLLLTSLRRQLTRAKSNGVH